MVKCKLLKGKTILPDKLINILGYECLVEIKQRCQLKKNILKKYLSGYLLSNA